MRGHPKPDPVGPGQESVWDFPRPPAIRHSEQEITVVLGGEQICTTRSSWLILETSHPPTYYLPQDAFVPGALVPAPGGSFCEWKGQASYLDLVGGERTATRAAWFYPRPNGRYSELADHIALYAGAVDFCTVDRERVVPQPGGFYGGWVTSAVSGPFKGIPGSNGW
ncbi:MAG TPA: DUF427 domain-containing protein [Propionibacteriaceae bacterium]